MSLHYSDIRSLVVWLVIMLAIVLYLALYPLEWVPEEIWLRTLMGVILLFLVYRFRDTLFDTADRLAGREKKERKRERISSGIKSIILFIFFIVFSFIIRFGILPSYITYIFFIIMMTSFILLFTFIIIIFFIRGVLHKPFLHSRDKFVDTTSSLVVISIFSYILIMLFDGFFQGVFGFKSFMSHEIAMMLFFIMFFLPLLLGAIYTRVSKSD